MTIDELIKQLQQLKEQFNCGNAQMYTNHRGQLVELRPELMRFDSGNFHVNLVRLIGDTER